MRPAISQLMAVTLSFFPFASMGLDRQVPSDAEISRLVAQLNDPTFRVREMAVQELGKLTFYPAQLQLLMASDDPELKKQAIAINSAIAENRIAIRLKSAYLLGEDGRIDRVADILAEIAKERQSPPDLSPLHKAIAKILTKANVPVAKNTPRTTERLAKIKAFDYVSILREEVGSSKSNNDEVTTLLVAPRVSDKHWLHGIILSANSIEIGRSTSGSILVGSGNNCIGGISSSFAVFDGDLQTNQIITSVVFVSGKITLIGQSPTLDQSIVIAGGEIENNPLPKLRPDKKFPEIQEKCAEPFKFVKWFKCLDAGVTVKFEKESLRISVIDDKCSLALQGLKKDDVVVEIDGAKVESENGFRLMLRQSLARDRSRWSILRDGQKRVIDFQAECP